MPINSPEGSDTPVDAAISKLQQWFGDCPSAIVAFSGGTDSALVAFLATKYLGKDRVLAAIGNSASLKNQDLLAAQSFAEQYQIPLRIITTCEIDDPQYHSNPQNRCYYCKRELFTRLDQLRREMGFAQILSGENCDDLSDFRPGIQAGRQLDVSTPLAACGLTKDHVRRVSRHLGLSLWDKPASPCLSSRIPYGSTINEAKLQQIALAETMINQLGFSIVRVRHYGETAKIEIPRQEIKQLEAHLEHVIAEFHRIGFTRVEVDPEGFVSGKLNRVIVHA